MDETKNLVAIEICDENGNLFTTIEISEELMNRVERLAAKAGCSPEEMLDRILHSSVEKYFDGMATEIKAGKENDL